MYKSIFVIFVLSAVISSLLLCSCGIPQEQYDGILAEVEQARAELAEINDTHSAAVAALADMTANLTAITEKLAELEEKVREAEETRDGLTSSRQETEEAIDVQDKLFIATRQENSELQKRIPNLEYKTFESDSAFFTMDYPTAWKPNIDMQSYDSGVVLFAGDATSEAACMVIFGAPEPGSNLDNFFDSFIDNIGQTEYTAYLMRETRTRVGERDAVSGIVVLDPEVIDKICYHIVCIDDHGTYYTIAFFCPWYDFVYLTHMFNEMLESVTFI